MSRKPISRRAFLQRSAATAGALAATQSIAPEPMKIPGVLEGMAAERVRFGIIGVGMQGSPLLATAVGLPGTECVAVCDLYDGRHTLAREIAGPKIKTTRRYKELLGNKEIDCLIAAVPDHWHKQIVVDACNAGKDIYCEKPMSHTAAEGVEMYTAAQKNNRIVQIGSQRVSSVLCTKAKEMVAQGALGDLMMVEGWLGRNDPTGAWQYPPPFDLSPQNLDWDTWQGNVSPKISFDPNKFARWRCWKAYGTGVAGDLLVHLVSGMMFVLGINEPPQRALSLGGILHWKDGRNMPDVHATLFEYGQIPVYMRLNLGTEMPETYRFQGTRGILEVTEFGLSFMPQSGKDTAPSYYDNGFPRSMREAYEKQWHEENDPKLGQESMPETVVIKGPDFDDVKPHLWAFFQGVRSRKPVVEDVVFGHHAALACHMANESYFRGKAVSWDDASH